MNILSFQSTIPRKPQFGGTEPQPAAFRAPAQVLSLSSVAQPATGANPGGAMPGLNAVYFGVKSPKIKQVTFGGYNNLKYIGPPLLIDPEFVDEYERITQPGFQREKTMFEKKFDNYFAQYQALSSGDDEEFAKPSREKMAALEKVILRNGIVKISGPVSDAMAEMVSEKVNILVSIMKKTGKVKPIIFVINSPGGSILSMNNILDSMDMAKRTQINGENIPVATYVQGYAASAASVITANGSPGYRSMSPRAEIMIHQPLGGASGQETDIAIAAKRIRRMKDEINEFFVRTTKMPDEMLKQVMERDYWMSSKDSKEFGFVDEIADQFRNLELTDEEREQMTGEGGPKDRRSRKPSDD